MTLYPLLTKSVKELHSECKSLGLKSYRQKNKSDLIKYLHLKRCFQAISTFEDDEYDILKLYFARLKSLNIEQTGQEEEQEEEQEVEQEEVVDSMNIEIVISDLSGNE